MSKKGVRRALACLIALAAFLLACRASRSFASAALNGLSLPAMGLLHQLSAPVPFPVAELLALALASYLLFSLAASVIHAARSRSIVPLRRWVAGLLGTALALGGALALLWGPASEATTSDALSIPMVGQLEWLCGELTGALNRSELTFPDSAEALRLAPGVAGMPGCAVKAARYPEWMRAASVSGLFVPLTGEALTDAGAPAPLVPFTAVHELMHLSGIADEGAANVAAWEQCLSAGGAFADSARLWALRYAMGLLCASDESAWQRARAKMEGALERAFYFCGGEAMPVARAPFGINLLSLSRGDYAALTGYLIENGFH